MPRLVLPMIAVTLAIAGCVPTTGDVSRADYERHKANRDAYMYQGGP
ncbi:hypothetical protein ACFORG_16835 [Lutimaribacter marinistellae]|uniref:Lipoprotein n=1 Tax=Lutimaribacter marinistellae TaxID=1820329 RepID=A0ABV7TKW1_9RHOB